MLSSEVKTLLDKLYNLRGEDSVILAKMNKEREEAIETGERTKNEKEVLLSKIDKLTKEEETLQEEGNKLTSILSNINRDDFANVLDRLQIDFDPASINEKITNMLPETIEKVVIENKKASEELESVETEMNNAITKVEELGIRKDEALSNQAKLNEYFALALEGNINITRDAITSLLEKFDFNEDEQREAAKILMFPEDALYEYDASFKSGSQTSGKTITEVLMEAKKESKPEVKEKIRAIINKIIQSSSQIKSEVNSYINACIETEKIKNINNTSQRSNIKMEQTIKRETEFILKKVDNQILEFLKESKGKIMEEQQKLFEKDFDKKKCNKLILNILSKKMSHLFININNDLNNTLNVKKYLNKKTINLSLSKRAKREFALKHRDVGTIDWEK